MLIPRRGHTLLELLVSIVVGTIVLSAAATVGVAQARAHRRVRAAVSAAGVRRDVTDVVPTLLESLSSGAGDIPQGGARDTTLDFREVVFTGLGCLGVAGRWLLFSAAEGHPTPAAADVAAINPSDSMWTVDASDSVHAWRGSWVGGTATVASACAPDSLGRVPSWSAGAGVALTAADSTRGLTGVRITRRARLSIYRASDGAWYLGLREWSASLGRLDVVQPVAGPLASPSAKRPTFVYRDASGISLGTAAAAAPSTIATIAISAAPSGDPLDSSVVRAAPDADRVLVALQPR